MSMIAHVSLGVRQLDRALRFYDAALATLGYQRHFTFGEAAGYGPDRHHIHLWLNVHYRQDQRPHAPSSGAHLALAADTRLAVDAFHAVALRNGGRDNGRPGLRTQYAPNYYAAFVFDPDGNHVEAVCFVQAAPPVVHKPAEPSAAPKPVAAPVESKPAEAGATKLEKGKPAKAKPVVAKAAGAKPAGAKAPVKPSVKAPAQPKASKPAVGKAPAAKIKAKKAARPKAAAKSKAKPQPKSKKRK
jgi:catechol 2,3-dioxygenase-like lactoylglutathione lyase family enzyme